MNKNSKKKAISILITVFGLACLTGIIYSSYNLFVWKNNSNKNKNINEKNHKSIKKDKKNSYNIDFAKLKKENPDVVAYIKVNGTNIDYVVVKGEDNEYYLNHNFTKEKNITGWIFMDYNNKLDDTDKNIIIYGHNTHDDNMFSTLQNTLDSTWQDNIKNRKITFITEKGKYKYEVFSTYSIVPEDYYIKTIFETEQDYGNFLQTIKNRSNYDFKTDVDINDTILTLSTCNATGSKRYVLHAKRIN